MTKNYEKKISLVFCLFLLLCFGTRISQAAEELALNPDLENGVRLEATEQGGYLCKTPTYEAQVDRRGNLLSLKAGGVDFLARAGGTGPAAGFIHKRELVLLSTVRKEKADTLVAEGEPKDPAKSVPSNCPFNARATYHFKPDCIELGLEQSMDVSGSGGFVWIPSSAILTSYDATTDYATNPAEFPLYAHADTDPRWTTKEGPMLHFDFGVWQSEFANANWVRINVEGKDVKCLQSIVPTGPFKVVVYPIVRPTPKDALTFNSTAEDPDLLFPAGMLCRPLQFMNHYLRL